LLRCNVVGIWPSPVADHQKGETVSCGVTALSIFFHSREGGPGRRAPQGVPTCSGRRGPSVPCRPSHRGGCQWVVGRFVRTRRCCRGVRPLRMPCSGYWCHNCKFWKQEFATELIGCYAVRTGERGRNLAVWCDLIDEVARTMITWQSTHVCDCGRSPRPPISILVLTRTQGRPQ